MSTRNKETTHKIMSSIKSRDTKPEICLRKALWHLGYRYKKNVNSLPGKPDVVLPKYHVVIFCDGDFWHGHNWALRGFSSLDEELNCYTPYWREKILRNITRDKEVTQALEALGWRVIRLWESEIKKDLNGCVDFIVETLFETQLELYNMRQQETTYYSDDD